MRCSFKQSQASIVRDVTGLIVLTMERIATASTPMASSAGTHLANDNCHPQAVIIGTGEVHDAH